MLRHIRGNCCSEAPGAYPGHDGVYAPHGDGRAQARGTGWLKYDRIFRKNNSAPSASWDVLDPSLLTIVANQGYNPRFPCHHCQELNHTSGECALAPLEQPTRALPQGKHTGYSRLGKRAAPYDTTRYTSCFQSPQA